MASCCSIRIYLLKCAGLALALLAQPVMAGPPFVSDDPEPTPDRHFEIYTFNNGTNTRDGTGGEAGIDFRAPRKIAAFLNLCESNCRNRIRGCGYDGSIRFF